MMKSKIKFKIKKIIPPLYRTIARSVQKGHFMKMLDGEKRLSAIHKKYRAEQVNGRRKRILYYPGFPGFGYVIYNMCRVLGYKMIQNPNSDFDLAVNWDDRTTREINPIIKEIGQNHHVVNLKCNNVEKNYISSVFKEIFGYSVLVDPLTYEGVCLVKSSLNARKDGSVIECPIQEKVEGMVYQKLIDNLVSDDYVQDIRVPIVGKSIPFVYLKYRKIDERFKEAVDAEIKHVNTALSENEVEKILNFCERIGMDYGELDVLRDREDQRIYIVDANNTPHGPPQQMDWDKRAHALKLLAKAFEDEFMNVERKEKTS